MKRTLFLLTGILLPGSAVAANLATYGYNCTGFLYCNGTNVVAAMTNNLIGGVGAIILPIATVAFLYGAIRMITSRGDEGKEAGKKALIYASLGLAAALLTEAIIAFVTGLIV